MSDKLILVGRVAGAFGVRGELRITTHTADPVAIAAYGALLGSAGQPVLELSGVRPTKGGVIARAREVDTREQAEALRGLQLYIDRDRLPPSEDDEFYLTDLIGLDALSPAGEALGVVKSVHDFGAGDLLEIQPAAGPSWWLPFTREAVPEVDLAAGRIVALRPEESE